MRKNVSDSGEGECFMKKTGRILVSVLLLVALAVNTTGCNLTSKGAAIKASNLMSGVTPNKVSGKTPDSAFTKNMADLSLALFKESIVDKQASRNQKNTLISPLSIALALTMTANGADNETRAQLEALLGGGISIDDLNEYFYSYVKGLPSEEKAKLGIANSIWFRDDEGRLKVDPDFLQKNADYYGASAYGSAFDEQTLKDINNWVSKNTDGMIKEVLDEIDENAVLYLINAIVFDAEWQKVYKKNDIHEEDFTDIDGKTQRVDFMYSDEYLYLDDGEATGFIKPYAGGAYSFVALLPNEDVNIYDYIDSLDGAGFLSTLENAEHILVNASMPEFEFEYEIEMKDILSELGIPDAFDSGKANFSRMATSSLGDISIGKVLHNTFISVDELGTRAGAVTVVEMNDVGAAMDTKTVRLDRPFVFMIVDNSTDLPIFIGTLMTVL